MKSRVLLLALLASLAMATEFNESQVVDPFTTPQWRLGQPHLLDHITTTQQCWSPVGWYFLAPPEQGGVNWYSFSNSIFASIAHNLPPFVSNRDVSKRNYTHQQIHTILDGKADMIGATMTPSWQFYQYVDFSTPISFSYTTIISSKKIMFDGRVVEGIFDNISYILIGVSLIFLALAFWIFLKGFHFQADLVHICLTTLGLLLRQGMTSQLNSKPQWTLKLIMALIGIFSFFISSMYSSVIIARLTTRMEANPVDSLEDLVTTHQHLRIFIRENALQHEVLKESVYYDQLRDRFDFIDKVSLEKNQEEFAKIYQGTHVRIDYTTNMNFYFDKAFSREFVCRHPKDKFRFAKNNLVWSSTGFIFRKKFEYYDYFNTQLLWMVDYGFRPIQDRVKPNQALYSPTIPDHQCLPAESKVGTACPIVVEQVQFPLNLTHLSRLASFYGVGMALALLAFSLELCLGPLRLCAKWQ